MKWRQDSGVQWLLEQGILLGYFTVIYIFWRILGRNGWKRSIASIEEMPSGWPGKVSLEGLDAFHLHPDCESLSYQVPIITNVWVDWKSIEYNGKRNASGHLNGI
jgi:hypothetical protein